VRKTGSTDRGRRRPLRIRPASVVLATLVVIMLALPVSASATVTRRIIGGCGETGGRPHDGWDAWSQCLNGLGQIARGPDGSLYYEDEGSEASALIKETPDGGLHVLAEVGGAEGIAVGSDGSVFVAVAAEHTVWKYSADGTSRVRYAGSGSAGSPIPGAATSSPLLSPVSLAVDSSGNLYIADFAADRIEKVTPGGTLSIFAGTGTWAEISSPSGPATSTPVAPRGVAVDSQGDVYIATDFAEIAKVTPGGTLTRLATLCRCNRAEWGNPLPDVLHNLTVDAAGNVYVTDESSMKILELSASGVLSTFAGSGAEVDYYKGAGLPPTEYAIWDPRGVVAGPDGEIYYTAWGSGTVGLVRSYAPHVNSITPLDASPTQGGDLRFHVAFDEPVFGVKAGDFSLVTTGTAAGSVTSVSGDDGPISSSGFTVTVHSAGGDGTLRLDLKSSGTTIINSNSEYEGNYNAFGYVTSHGFTSGQTYTIDNTPPGVTSIKRWYGEATGNSVMEFNILFDTEVTGAVPGDFAVTASAGVTGATVTRVQAAGIEDTVWVEAHGKGAVRLDLKPGDGTIKDAAGNGYRGPGHIGDESYQLDQTPPTVTSWALDDPQFTAGNQVSFTVTFDQVVEGVPTNVGVLASGTVTGAGAAPEAIGSTNPLFPASETWRITLTGLAGDGTLAIQMLAGNTAGWGPIFGKQLGVPLAATATSPFYVLDHTAPRPVSLTRVGDASTTAASVQYKLTFSEQTGGVDTGDLTPLPSAGVGATVSAVTWLPDEPSSYLVTLSGITGTGTLGLELAGSGTAITDAAGNPLVGGLTATELFSVSPPAVEESGGSGSGEGDGSSGSGGGSSGGGNPSGGSPVATANSSLAATSTPGACTEHPALKSNGWVKGALSVQAAWPSVPTATCSLTATLTGRPAKKGKKAPVLGTASVVLGKAGVETFTVKLNAAGRRLVKRGRTVPVTLTLLDGETVVVAKALKLSPVA
jgi:hypothetical protein